MNAKFLAGLFLCIIFLASISMSQSAAVRHDSRLRSRRQDNEDDGEPANHDGDDGDVYDDNEEDKQTLETTTSSGNVNDAEDEAIDDHDNDAKVTTTPTPVNPPPKEPSGSANSEDDVEYYDEDDDDEEENTTPIEPSVTPETNGENGHGDDDGDHQDDQHPSPHQPGTDHHGADFRVVVSPDVIDVHHGQTVELTCTVHGGDSNTNIYWIQNEPEQRHAITEPVSPYDKQASGSQVTLKTRIVLDDPSKIGRYSCMAQDSHGHSGSAVLTMRDLGGGHHPQPGGHSQNGDHYPQPGDPGAQPAPSGGRGTLRIVAPEMNEGDYIEIQCEGAAPEDEGRIQWYFNNRLVESPALSDEQPIYPRGKTLHIRPISRAYLGNYRCSVPGSGYTDGNSVITFSGFAPGPAPAPTAPPAPAPTQPPVVPVYPYQPNQPIAGRCNIDEATCRNGRCIPRAYLCDGKDDCGDNSDESCGPLNGSGSDICQPNEIRCSDTSRGRKCVQKFWTCDGDRDCDDGSDENPRYCELLPRQRFCQTSEFHCAANGTYGPICVPRSFQCDSYNDCPDQSDEVGCTKPTIISPPQRQIQINAGDTLTIQCTARGTPPPYINWRLNWGHVCGDGSDNGRCTMAQSADPNDPNVVTGTLTVRNTNANDGGAYSCEALNNQGFTFAIPDAIVNIIIEQRRPVPPPSCNCNGHSSSCTSDGRCLNCQHNTAGSYCEYCAPGYQGDARRGTPYDCQLIPTVSPQRCDPYGTHMERGGRCICKYNVEGDRCDQCKRNHFYLNPATPNGCVACFCSGVTSDCTSSNWPRKAIQVPLNNWSVVPKNFAVDRYEARDFIQQRDGGGEISIDQSALGRSPNEVLYWKAPNEALDDYVTLYDGNIDIHFSSDGRDGEAPSSDDFIWLRGNNIDLVHKLPSSQQYRPNSEVSYSVPVNERTFTRKDGTHIDRENILMALSDLDSLLIKVNPLGGQRTSSLRGVTLNVAARDGNGSPSPTVESCRCPANYTGPSCEKCAEGYGRPHPLVGIYLGQCWSCRSLCHERSDQCDRESGKCSNCQGNTEGDRCERCRAGYSLDSYNQCVPSGYYQPYPPAPAPGPEPGPGPAPEPEPAPVPPYDSGSRGAYYLDQRPYDVRSGTPMSIVLDGNQPEQRFPLQVLNVQPQSVVWGRTDGSSLPINVVQEGNDLVFRNPSSEQAGNYICTITHPDGYTDRIPVYVEYRPAQHGHGHGQGHGQSHGLSPVFSPETPLSIGEGSSQFIQPPSEYQRAYWTRAGGQPLPSGIQQNGNGLQIVSARPDHSGTYYCQLYGHDGSTINVPYEIRVQASERPQPAGGSPPKVSIQPKTINLKEGQRMIVRYTVASNDPIEVVWNKLTDQGYQPIPSLFTVEPNSLVLPRATPDAAGTYQVVVRNQHGEDRQELHINVEPRRGRPRGPQAAGSPQIHVQQTEYDVGPSEQIQIAPHISGGEGASMTWSKDGSTYLPDGVTQNQDGSLRIEGRSSDVAGRYVLDVKNAYGQSTSQPITVQWRDGSNRKI